jgi:lipopolysaccharide export LptBFGC system permease protein LptF
MSLTDRELWAVIHGLILGTLFLLSFSGGFVGIYSLRERLLTEDGVQERLPRMLIGGWIMAIVAWLTVITGTWIVYPWYRAMAPEGADLTAFPRSLLLSDPATSAWHTFGMEWKEHVAWIAPMLATSVAFVILYYGVRLARRGEMRWPLLAFFTLAFVAAGVAGAFGAFITKAAPVY